MKSETEKDRYMTGMETLLLGYLAWETKTDIREKQIEILPSLAVLGAALLLQLFRYQTGILQTAAGLLPGCALWMVGRATREAVGYGDAVLLAVCGGCMGAWTAIELLLLGLMLLCPAAWILFLRNRANRKKEIPFAPFLLAGYLIWLYLE